MKLQLLMQVALQHLLLVEASSHVTQRIRGRQSGPVDPGTIKDCTFWETAEDASYTCATFENDFGLTFAQFFAYNPSVRSDCTGIKIGNSYCVEENYGNPPLTTTTTRTSSSATVTTTAGPSPTQSGLAANCNAFYKVKDSEYCQDIVDKFGTFSLADFYTWNPAVGSTCAHLQANTYVCVGVPGTPTGKPTTTTSTATGLSPTQTGIMSTCNSFYQAKDGDGCQVIVDKFHNFTLANFYSWNPAVGNSCTGLRAGYYYCIGVPGQPISQDGICGFNGRTCIGSKFGNCCGKNYYCGSGIDSCAVSNGCLGSFGTCQAVSDDGVCGYNGKTCVGSKFGSCCSKNYYCGSGIDYCSVSNGCLSLFGTCQAVTEDGICGFNARTCIGGKFGNCCGKDYKCGSAAASCSASNGCLSAFGTC